jgi:multiple sugar transport system ATP-binding protein
MENSHLSGKIMATLELRQLEKKYGSVSAVNSIDLTIENSEFVVLVGPSGCGKSTILRMIAGLEKITGGQVLIDNLDCSDLPPRKRDVAMVFQDYALYPHMNVKANISFGLKMRGVDKPAREKKVAEIADQLEISELLMRTPSELSGGQRQRVAMGRAIVREPKLFLFDEPLSNLDAKLRNSMRANIKRLHQQFRTTSVYVTHDQVEAMTLADRIVILNKGEIVQIGTPLEIYENPNSRFVAEFIGSPPINVLSGTVQNDEIVLASGDIIAFSPKSRRVAAEGQAVDVAIRPDKFSLRADGQNTLTGIIEMSEQLGEAQLFHLNVNGKTLTVFAPSHHPVEIGAELTCSFNSEDIYVFGGDNMGARLA